MAINFVLEIKTIGILLHARVFDKLELQNALRQSDTHTNCFNLSRKHFYFSANLSTKTRISRSRRFKRMAGHEIGAINCP